MKHCVTLLLSLAVQVNFIDSFQMLTGNLANSVDRRVDNVELLQYAALTGEDVTANITIESQLVIAQHAAYVTLDCVSFLFPDEGASPVPSDTLITWTRRGMGPEVNIDPGQEAAAQNGISIEGPFNSRVRLLTDIIHDGGDPNGGIYKCIMCPSSKFCQARSTEVFLIGSRPAIKEPDGCLDFADSLICTAGDNTTAVVPTTATLSLTCEEALPAMPPSNFSWTKDGLVVVRNASKNRIPMIDDEFLNMGDNAVLFMIMPMPLMITFELQIKVRFSHTPRDTNMSSLVTLPEGVSVEDIILSTILGKWTCSAVNAFGSDSKSSLISVAPTADCDSECRNCLGLSSCQMTSSGCQAICCLPGYDLTSERLNCTDIDECVSPNTNNCSLQREDCINTEGGYVCSCKTAFIRYSAGGACIGCEVGDGEGIVTLTVAEVCDRGSVPYNCSVFTNGTDTRTIVTSGEGVCPRGTESGGNLGVIVAVAFAVVAIAAAVIGAVVLIIVSIIQKHPHVYDIRKQEKRCGIKE